MNVCQLVCFSFVQFIVHGCSYALCVLCVLFKYLDFVFGYLLSQSCCRSPNTIILHRKWDYKPELVSIKYAEKNEADERHSHRGKPSRFKVSQKGCLLSQPLIRGSAARLRRASTSSSPCDSFWMPALSPRSMFIFFVNI
ncbi:hypothetical protein BZA70DRAFT_113470 [Myxozyma melibiosi]|uniref:Uncharacterized protein n=1 Tax=Myxozyma melibiosi TaxID=54550 RepID=A0ABR1FA94_9ASCO